MYTDADADEAAFGFLSAQEVEDDDDEEKVGFPEERCRVATASSFGRSTIPLAAALLISGSSSLLGVCASMSSARQQDDPRSVGVTFPAALFSSSAALKEEAVQ